MHLLKYILVLLPHGSSSYIAWIGILDSYHLQLSIVLQLMTAQVKGWEVSPQIENATYMHTPSYERICIRSWASV